MRIAALAFNHLIQVPPDTEAEEAKRVAAAVHQLKVVEAPEPSSDESLEDETRAGLKRLTDLIRRKKREKDEESQEEQPDRHASSRLATDDSQSNEKAAATGEDFKRIQVEDLPRVSFANVDSLMKKSADRENRERVVSAYAKVHFCNDPQNIRGVALDKYY
jgi:hypothetical protein